MSIFTDPLGIGDKAGINDAFDDAGIGAANFLENPGTALLDPGDLAGTHRAGKAQDALDEAEAAQLDATERARQDLLNSKAEALGFLDPSKAQAFLDPSATQSFLDPFQQLGQQGLSQASFLTDPNQQAAFLKNNPLFTAALENANTQTNQSAAARGRLSAGDTMQQLSNNTFLAGAPLIQQQKNSIQDLLGFGTNVAGNQASLLQNTQNNQASLEQNAQQAQANAALGVGTGMSGLSQDVGNILSSGIAGRNQAQAQATENQNNMAGQIFSMFSDPSLKTNIKRTGDKNGFNTYSWDWNELGNKLGLFGSSKGVMADEVATKNPEAVSIDRGFMKVNYSMIGF